MPRASRHHLPGLIWHLTHRCHHRRFLLRFARDRRAWIGWLYEARRRFGLCVLDYCVTSNDPIGCSTTTPATNARLILYTLPQDLRGTPRLWAIVEQNDRRQ